MYSRILAFVVLEVTVRYFSAGENYYGQATSICPGNSKNVTCESWLNHLTTCLATDFGLSKIGAVSIEVLLSKPCIYHNGSFTLQDYTGEPTDRVYGYHDLGVWVRNECKATFSVCDEPLVNASPVQLSTIDTSTKQHSTGHSTSTLPLSVLISTMQPESSTSPKQADTLTSTMQPEPSRSVLTSTMQPEPSSSSVLTSTMQSEPYTLTLNPIMLSTNATEVTSVSTVPKHASQADALADSAVQSTAQPSTTYSTSPGVIAGGVIGGVVGGAVLGVIASSLVRSNSQKKTSAAANICPWVWACLSFMITQVHCGPGTTANIEEIFFGRCYQYQEITTNKLLKPPPSSIDCPLLWDTFKSAFVYKDPTAITRADYQPFFDLAKQTNIPANKSVLWSGTYDITHRYAADGTRYVTMEDSLIGYLSNGLHWCGSQSSGGGGINYTQCPDWTDLPTQASQAFWGGASSTFAGNSKGEIKLILSGSNPTRKAYERSSFFANFELPSINVHDATVSVVLANDVGKPALEQCDTGSLILLREDMTDRGLEFNCQENPRDILYLMCVDNPTAKKCQFSSPTQSKSIVDLVNPKSKNLVG